MATKSIADYGKEYEAAKKAGNYAGMKAANEAANAIRASQGQSVYNASSDIYKAAEKSAKLSAVMSGGTGISGSNGYWTDSSGNRISQAQGLAGVNVDPKYVNALIGGTTGQYNQDVRNAAGSSGSSGGSKYQGNQYVQNPAEEMRRRYIESQLAQLDINKRTQETTIDNAYRKNLTAYDQQQGKLGAQYQEALGQIDQSTFDQLRYSKELGSNRGITNSAQMQAQDRAVMRAGSQQRYAAQKDRDNAVNNIQQLITDLGAAYGADKATLEANYGSAKLKAMSDGELMALETQLKVDMFNAEMAGQFQMADKNYANQVELAKMNQGWNVDNTKLQHSLNMEMAKYQNDFQAKQNAISRSAATAAQKQAQYLQNNIGYAEAIASTWLTRNPNASQAQTNALNKALGSVIQGGDPSAVEKVLSNFEIQMTPMW